jgi:hypothetical protein
MGETLPSETLHAGEALLHARPPRNFLDPGAFDARGYFAHQGINLNGTLRSAELLQKLGARPLGIHHRLARLRGDLVKRVDTLFAKVRSPNSIARKRAARSVSSILIPR